MMVRMGNERVGRGGKKEERRYSPIPAMARILLLISICPLACAAATDGGGSGPDLASDSDGDEEIALRGGVVTALPYIVLADGGEGGGPRFEGYIPDMIRRLEAFAGEDGYRLTFELELADERAPTGFDNAFDLVSNDCNTTANPRPLERCREFDLMVAPYYVSPARSMRADLSPPYLRAALSTIKVIKDDPARRDFTTLSELEEGGGIACVQGDTFNSKVVMGKFPRVNYNQCEDFRACFRELKDGRCDLFAADDLMLRYQSLTDRTLKMTGEMVRSQYIVWALRYDLDVRKSMLLKKWMYAAVANGTLDELYSDYFDAKICPLGKSGANCKSYCSPENGKSDKFGTCLCNSMKWTGDDCSVEVKEELNLIPNTLKIASYVFIGINAVSCFICAVWLHWKRDTQHVKISQPFFLRLVLLGCLVSTSTIIVLSQESSGSGPVHACVAIPWLYSIGFSITFGTLFAKIWRVYRLFKAAVDVQRVKITVRETTLQIFAITSVDAIICAVWTIVDPLRWKRDIVSQTQFGEPLESRGYCISEHWKAFTFTIFAWHLVLLLLGCSLCYRSRNITARFSESRPLSIVMISNLQIFVISVPVLVLVGTQSATSFFIRAAVIWINDFVVIVIIFGSLMYSVHRNITQNLRPGSAIVSFDIRQRRDADRRNGRPTRAT